MLLKNIKIVFPIINIDVHSLQFTQDSFKNIINLLNQLNYIDLVIDNVYNTYKK